MNAIQVNLAVQDKSLLARWESFKYGWDLHTARESITRCGNAEQVRGYLAACSAEAAATLPATSANRLGF